MNKLGLSQRAAIVRGLVEGNSIRSVTRMTGNSKGAVLRLLAEVGQFSAIYQDHAHRNLPCRRVEADEIWGYCGAKEKNATKAGQGDLWTYTAICADSKLVVSWLVGRRSSENTQSFMQDVAARLANRVQLTTDGLSWYLAAVENAFGWSGVDYGQIIKTYGLPLDETERQRRYSPMVCTGGVKTRVMGDPDYDKVSTSYVERANLSIRMGMRRMTRLTNGFSKKAENHAHAFAIHMMHFNYCRPHQTLTKAAGGVKTTPAMACGLTDHVWTVEEMLELMDPNKSLQ
jgi:IS1 family transposase